MESKYQNQDVTQESDLDDGKDSEYIFDQMRSDSLGGIAGSEGKGLSFEDDDSQETDRGFEDRG